MEKISSSINTIMAANSVYIRDYHKEIPGALSPDRLTWLFPQINSKNSHQKTTEWRICVKLFREGTNPTAQDNLFIEIKDEYFNNKPLPGIFAWIKVDSRIEGGKIKKSEPTIVRSGKNIGKASETNVFCQALRDALGIHNKQLKKAVGNANVGSRTERFPPMLAQVLKDQKTALKFDPQPYIQRKYNGVRTVTTLDCDPTDDPELKSAFAIMYSRRKLLYPGFQYHKDELLPVLRAYWSKGRRLYLDGEIYKHGIALQDISGQARREAKSNDIKYDYMIYDCFIANEPELLYTDRKAILDDIFKTYNFKYAKSVETFQVESLEEIYEYYKIFLEEGFEGAMIRIDAPYRYSYNEHHSKVLLKLKETRDMEAPIVSWTTGEKGKAADALMIICEIEGKQFPCTPAMEIPDRIALAKKMATIEENGNDHFTNHWKGKKIIIYYDELSRDHIPQRARTKMEIRNWD
jgi:ATP-dependent DNA ligase